MYGEYYISKRTNILDNGFAQVKPVKIAKNANRFTYEVYDYGESIDTSLMQIVYHHPFYQIFTMGEEGPFVPGYAQETTIVNLDVDSAYPRRGCRKTWPPLCWTFRFRTTGTT